MITAMQKTESQTPVAARQVARLAERLYTLTREDGGDDCPPEAILEACEIEHQRLDALLESLDFHTDARGIEEVVLTVKWKLEALGCCMSTYIAGEPLWHVGSHAVDGKNAMVVLARNLHSQYQNAADVEARMRASAAEWNRSS